MRPRLPIMVRRRLVAAATTWNPADKTSGLTLSNGNLTANFPSGSGGDQGTRSTTSKTSGKWVFEALWNGSGTYADTGAGIALAGSSFASLGANGTGGFIAYVLNGGMFLNAVNQGLDGWNAGQTLMVAIDLGNNKLWIATSNNPGKWNNTTSDPATNTGGFSLASLSGPKYAVVTLSNGASGQAMTGNFKGPFVNAVPAGFSAWG
jgi:hypothetical protein